MQATSPGSILRPGLDRISVITRSTHTSLASRRKNFRKRKARITDKSAAGLINELWDGTRLDLIATPEGFKIVKELLVWEKRQGGPKG